MGEPERLPLGRPARGLTRVRSLRVFVLALSFWTLVLLAQAKEASAPDVPVGPVVQPLAQPATGGKGPGMGRSYQRNTPGPGRGYPGYRSGPAGAAAPAPNLPPDPGDFPVYGPPPGLGPGYGGQRYRGGPGYPGLRGPGTGYPRHRQYANPPLYPVRPPKGQDRTE